MTVQLELHATKVPRNKIVAVGLLSCLLMLLLFRSANKSQTSIPTSVCDGYAAPASMPTAIVKNTALEPNVHPLPTVDLKVVIAHDPFRSRPSKESILTSSDNAPSGSEFPKTAVSITAQPPIEQTEISVTAIVTGGNRAAALIGDQLYFENDLLGDGRQIVAIKSSSILVANVKD